ncbi:MAG: acyltransferase [Deltaproteobacteria bacterium]|nr:acyltransferase [Deltaproteobacteria bacterium]
MSTTTLAPAWRNLGGAAEDARSIAARVKSLFGLKLLANHFPALHGLRVIAIVLVVQVHVTMAVARAGLATSPLFTAFSMQMFFGMDLFFVLSGFLIGSILLKSGDGGRFRGRDLLRFYVRRGVRTFPLYYVVLTALALGNPLGAAHPAGLLREYTYLANYNGPIHGARVMPWGWSLCVEEHFYLAAPFVLSALLLLRSHAARLAVLGAIWSAGLATRFAALAAHEGPWNGSWMFTHLYIRTHTRFDILVAGILLAYVHHHFSARIAALFARRRWRALAWSVVLACLALLVARPFLAPRSPVVQVFAWGTITSVMYVPLILLLLYAGGRVGRFLSHPLFLRAATLGYGVYLVHIPVCMRLMPFIRASALRWGLPLAITWPLTLALMLAVSAAVAYALHLLVEKPALALRERVAA